MVIFALVELACFVATLLDDPLLLARVQLALELTIVHANLALRWVVKAVANVVCARGNPLWLTRRIVRDESLTVWAERVLRNFSVEATVVVRRVIPFFVFEFQIVEEEVVSLHELTAVPFRNVASLSKGLS